MPGHAKLNVQRHYNVQQVTAEIFVELFWMTPFFVAFSCEESKGNNVVSETNEAVATKVERWNRLLDYFNLEKHYFILNIDF